MQKKITLTILDSQEENSSTRALTYTTHNEEIYLQNTVNEKDFTTSLSSFIQNIKDNDRFEIKPSWFVDLTQQHIYGPSESFPITKKESKFLKMLLNESKIITYNEMKIRLWDYHVDATPSAIRCFVRDIKKKLPLNTLKNYSGVGYKLINEQQVY